MADGETCAISSLVLADQVNGRHRATNAQTSNPKKRAPPNLTTQSGRTGRKYRLSERVGGCEQGGVALCAIWIASHSIK